MQASADPGYQDQMKEFPCCFNLVRPEKITLTKLRAIRYKLVTELEIEDDFESEIIRKKNMLSWIYFRLERQEDALKLSNEIVELTQWNNIASLANRWFIMQYTGDELEAKKCLKYLVEMKSKEKFDSLITEAKAEQAYYYSRIGGFENLQEAIDLFSEVVSEVPNNYLWKFGLGLVYRRSTHANIFCNSPKQWDVDKCTKQAIQCFFEVADNGDSRLKSMAYAQLVFLRQIHKTPEYNQLFRQLHVKNLIAKALEQGGSMPQVLIQCGKALRWIDVDESIRLLEKSIQIRPNSMSYHYLGKSYKRKAQMQVQARKIESGEQFPQSIEGNGAKGNSYCLSREISEPIGSSYSQPRDVGGAHRQLFSQHSDSEQGYTTDKLTREHSFLPTDMRWADQQGYTSTNYTLASEHSFLPTDMRWAGQQGYQHPACTFSKRTEHRGISNRDHLQLLQRSTSAVIPASQTSPNTFDQSYESPLHLGQPWVQPSTRSQFSQHNYNTSRYNQRLPHGQQKQFGHWENSGKSHSYHGINNFDGSLSSPNSDHETNRQYQTQGCNRRRARGIRMSPSVQPSIRSPFSKDNFYAGQYNQTLPHGQQKHFSQWENRGRGHSYRGRNNFYRPLSSPNSDHETNRQYQTQGRNSRGARVIRMSPLVYGIRACLRKPQNELYLNKDDECVKKTIDCFKKAIELVNENCSAILDLGILLKETGEIQEALKQFNKLTNSRLPSKENHLTTISAYEQAGLCYLKLNETEPPDSRCEEEGKKKLAQAVSLAADLALTMPELQERAQNLWTAFETLMNKIDGEMSSPNQLKEKIKLLELAKNHRQIVEIFQKMTNFTGDEHFDKEILVVAINSYLSLGQPENALALQNMIAIKPVVRESDWWNNDPMHKLRIKVLLQAIIGRLKSITDNPTTLFQQAFKMFFGTCVGASDCEEHNTPAIDFVGDVLIVFDDDEDDESPSCTKASSCCLKQVATSLFGLEAEENLNGNFEFGDLKLEQQLKEMLKYRVVIIILGNETRDPGFDAVLKCVPRNKRTEEPTNQRILVIDAGLIDGQVPLCLAHDECFKLQDIGGLGNLGQSLENRHGDNGDQISYKDILTHGFHGDVDAILKLFCFVIGQTWP